MCEIRENAMQKKQFQQNMKDKVRVFEDGGIRLLKRGQKGVVHAIFSRFGLVLVLLLLQAFALFSLLQWFGELLPHYFGGTLLVTAAMMVYLLNQDMDNNVRITWLVVTALMPVLGVPLFWYTKSDVGHNALKRRLLDLEGQTRAQLPQNEQTVELLQEQAPEAMPLARYLRGKGGGFPVYADTVATYFNGGEAMFDEMLRQLETAKKYIFLEYFIVDEGLMWGRILEVLARKAAQGVDVRLIYDDFGSLLGLPSDFVVQMERAHIRCIPFNPVVPLVSLVMNHRDHRKIVVVDGNTAYTGGINLADEYINEEERFGYWKDAALRTEGAAVWNFTVMFLDHWNAFRPSEEDYAPFMPQAESLSAQSDGVIQPYGDRPLDEEALAETVYLNIINQAQRYVYIYTPYFAVGETMLEALKAAAKRGVDVRLVLPGIPDKKLVFRLTRSYYVPLLRAGVRIYEFTPGFLHAKCYVSDDRAAVVGSINMDYRSLFLHFECGALLLYNSQVIALRDDVLRTLPECREVQLADCRTSLAGTLLDSVLRLLSPLM